MGAQIAPGSLEGEFCGRISAGILAGGKSSRMGENKAFLIWKEHTLLEHLADLLAAEPKVGQLLISVAEEEEYREAFRGWQGGTELMFVMDQHQDYGPLEGLYQLLAEGKYPWLFVTATDMPLLSREFIRRLIAQIPAPGTREELQAVSFASGSRKELQAVIPRAEGRIHPLCGLYAKSALPVLERLRRQGEHKVRRLLEELRVCCVDVEELGFSSGVLENVNTPEEYRRVLFEGQEEKA